MTRKCMGFTQYTLCVGDKVRIVQSDEIYTGTVIGFSAVSFDGVEIPIPIFRKESGEKVDGTGCWWVPLDKALQIEGTVKTQEEKEVKKEEKENGN